MAMKHPLRCLWIFVTLCCLGQAALYRGTITQTVPVGGGSDPDGWFRTDPYWYPDFIRGATFVGYYEYESVSMDGEFSYWGPSGEPNNNLEGAVFLPFPEAPGYGGSTGWNALTNTRNAGVLTVTGGIVTGFDWSFENAGLLAILRNGAFGAYVYNDLQYFYPPGTPLQEMWALGLEGTLTFGAPAVVDPRSTFTPYFFVPDTGTQFALPCALLLLLAMRRGGRTNVSGL